MGVTMDNNTIIRAVHEYELPSVADLVAEYKSLSVGEDSVNIALLAKISEGHEYTDAIYGEAFRTIRDEIEAQKAKSLDPKEAEKAEIERLNRIKAIKDLVGKYLDTFPNRDPGEIKTSDVRDLIISDGRYTPSDIGNIVISEIRGKLTGINQDTRIEEETDAIERAMQSYFDGLPDYLKGAQTFDQSAFDNASRIHKLDTDAKRDLRDQISRTISAEIAQTEEEA